MAAHDLNYVADACVLSLVKPQLPPVLLADIGGGSYPAMVNVLLALLQRGQTGEGSWLDIAMEDNIFPWLYWGLGNGFGAGAWPTQGGDLVTGELDSQVALSSYAMTLADTTWYTLRVVINGLWLSRYVDGTFKGNAIMSSGGSAAPKNSIINTNFLTLLTYGASVKFRNIKVWSLSTGAP